MGFQRQLVFRSPSEGCEEYATMKSKYLLRVISLLVLLFSFMPADNAAAFTSTAIPKDFNSATNKLNDAGMFGLRIGSPFKMAS